MGKYFSRLRQVVVSDLPDLKNELADAETRSARWRIRLSIIFRSLVILCFCVVFVVAFSLLLGPPASIAGVVSLLTILTFQKVHFGYKPSHCAVSALIIYGIYMTAPVAAQNAPPLFAFLINSFAIFFIVLLGCKRVEFHNHVILVLSYLLLFGYPISAEEYPNRLIALAIGAVWSVSILIRYHKNTPIDSSLLSVFTNFHVRNWADLWKIQLAVLIPGSIALGQLFGLQRPMWIGICALSVMNPLLSHPFKLSCDRVFGNILGCVLFSFITLIPNIPAAVIGVAGGFMVGLTSSYRYQSVFNSLGALSVAMLLFGAQDAVVERIVDNVLAALFIPLCVFLINRIVNARAEN